MSFMAACSPYVWYPWTWYVIHSILLQVVVTNMALLGEKVVLHFEILIDPTISTPFNEGTEKIDNILVLRLENGKDFFIVVSGTYHPTCFGVYLDQLALMTLPVSEAATAPSDKKSKKQQQSIEPSPQQATLPKELWRLLNFLWNKNMLCLVCIHLSFMPIVSNYYYY